MRKLPILIAAAMAACTAAGKTAPTDDFGSLSGLDEKSDAFSSKMKIVGALGYGQTSDVIYHSTKPRYRAFKLSGNAGDAIGAWVRSTDDGDSVAWLLDAKYKIVAKNDDADDTTLDSHLEATLAKTGTYYVVWREYSETKAHFTVELDGPTWAACQTDEDCTAVDNGGCCPDGTKAAVNIDGVADFQASRACTSPPSLCPLHVILDQRVPMCDATSHTCQMVDPANARCGGFTTHPHACPIGWNCQLTVSTPDIPGTCVAADACGGFVGTPCADGQSCVDYPGDGCDPLHGGADCPGVCSN
jgi:hypothetical protein